MLSRINFVIIKIRNRKKIKSKLWIIIYIILRQMVKQCQR